MKCLSFLVVFVLVIAAPALAQLNYSGYRVYGKVIGVRNGDTVRVQTPLGKTLLVRLSQIDAPEMGQPYGDTAKNFLMALTLDKDVTIVMEARDSGKTIARVFVGTLDVNLLLVQNGTAWAYRQYLTDDSLLKAEDEARQKKIGLWGLPPDQIVAPWDWRRNTATPDKNTPDKP